MFSNEHWVKVHDRDETFWYGFAKNKEGDGKFKEPCCLSVNKAGHLIVCDALNHRVHVFELNGKFRTKFGTKGSKKSSTW